MVPGFTGSTELDLPDPAHLRHGDRRDPLLRRPGDGEVPLLLLFSGTVFGTGDGRLSVQQVPWSKEASLPAAGQRLARGDRRALPEQRLDQDEPAARSTNCCSSRPARRCRPGRRRSRPAGRRPTARSTAMRPDPEHLEHARQVADAILYEGYLLYPYHEAAQKNQVRFQFGVLMPPAYAEVDPHEPAASQTECLLECPDDAEVRVLVRFLQLQHRIVQGVSPDNGELARRRRAARGRHRVHRLGRGRRAGAAGRPSRSPPLLAGTGPWSSTSAPGRSPRTSPTHAGRRRPAGPALGRARRRDPAARRAGRGPLPGAAAAGAGGEHARRRRPSSRTGTTALRHALIAAHC